MGNNLIKLKQEGFTLLEVLISVVLLFIVLTSFFTLFSQSLLFSSKNEEDLVAFNLASKTLKIVENKYKDTINQNIQLNCTNFPAELTVELSPSSCYFEENEKQYYPDITITQQASPESTFPILYVIHVKIYNSNNPSDQKLLSETFGYIRGM